MSTRRTPAHKPKADVQDQIDARRREAVESGLVETLVVGAGEYLRARSIYERTFGASATADQYPFLVEHDGKTFWRASYNGEVLLEVQRFEHDVDGETLAELVATSYLPGAWAIGFIGTVHDARKFVAQDRYRNAIDPPAAAGPSLPERFGLRGTE